MLSIGSMDMDVMVKSGEKRSSVGTLYLLLCCLFMFLMLWATLPEIKFKADDGDDG